MKDELIRNEKKRHKKFYSNKTIKGSERELKKIIEKFYFTKTIKGSETELKEEN
jgi:hypothetical protein